MRSGNPSREKYLCKTEADRIHYAAGIPYRYWRGRAQKPSCLVIRVGEMAVPARSQQAYQTALEDPTTWETPSMVFIGSQPSDDTAMHEAMWLARQMLARQHEVSIQNFGVSRDAEFDEDTLAHFGYNILPDMTADRAQRIRDWLTTHADSLRILVLAGNPLEIALNRLHIDPDAVIFLDDSKQHTVSQA